MVDVFLCDGVRTPIGRYAGALSSVRADDLAATVLSGLIKKIRYENNNAIEPIYTYRELNYKKEKSKIRIQDKKNKPGIV